MGGEDDTSQKIAVAYVEWKDGTVTEYRGLEDVDAGAVWTVLRYLNGDTDLLKTDEISKIRGRMEEA